MLDKRVLLLLPTHTYKAEDFLAAAGRLGIEVVVGTDRHQALEVAAPGGTMTLDFSRPEEAAGVVRRAHERRPFDGVVAADDEAVVLAALAAEATGIPANPSDAARACRDKRRMRERFRAAGLEGPEFVVVSVDDDPDSVARGVRYPCVLKPLFLNASRGVLRADDPDSFVRSFRRIVALLERPGIRASGGEAARSILVEDYLPGDEVTVEGVLRDGRLEVLALFDKPDTPQGPTFEETLFVTPSRLPAEVQDRVVAEVRRACGAIGLREGPVHAEVRVHDGVPRMLEVAARTIGGLCARALRFGSDISLEEVVLRHAVGLPAGPAVRERSASGVLMLPTPRAGVVRAIEGVDAARAVDGVVDVRITVERGAEVEPTPEGNRYLGFVFARGTTASDVEGSLREAGRRIGVRVVDREVGRSGLRAPEVAVRDVGELHRQQVVHPVDRVADRDGDLQRQR